MSCEEIAPLPSEGKVQDGLIETWFVRTLSDPPGPAVAPGDISVKLDDPYITGTKNNRRLTL